MISLSSFSFDTEWQQGDSADHCSGEHLHQGWSSQEGELQGQDGPAQQEEQEEGWTGQVHDRNSDCVVKHLFKKSPGFMTAADCWSCGSLS